MFVRVLGPLELHTARGPETPRGPKVRQVLALLVMHANHTVALDSLVEELWDGDPPRTGLSTLRTHLYHLRGVLRDDAGVARDVLVTRPSGYLLRVPDEQVDARRFLRMGEDGRSLLQAGRVEEAAAALAAALDLWRGRCLPDVAHGRLLAAHVSRLEELRTCALELRVEADLHLGRHQQLVAELRDLTLTHPLNEWFHARLMIALHRSGRRGEALRAFQELRRVLDDELGVEPSPEVQRLQAGILAGREDVGRGPLAGGADRAAS